MRDPAYGPVVQRGDIREQRSRRQGYRSVPMIGRHRISGRNRRWNRPPKPIKRR